MYRISMDSFDIRTETKEESFHILLRLCAFDVGSFSSYMGQTIEDVETAPQWAENYLKDTLHLNLVHLGYAMKDTKTDGLMLNYKNIVKQVDNQIGSLSLEMGKPIDINLGIITEGGELNSRPIIYAEDILQEFMRNNKPQ